MLAFDASLTYHKKGRQSYYCPNKCTLGPEAQSLTNIVRTSAIGPLPPAFANTVAGVHKAIIIPTKSTLGSEAQSLTNNFRTSAIGTLPPALANTVAAYAIRFTTTGKEPALRDQ